MSTYIVIIITSIGVVAGVLSNINDIVSAPQNIKEIIQKIFKRGRNSDEISYYFESQKGLINNKLQGFQGRVVYDQKGNEILDITTELKNNCGMGDSGYIFFEGRKKIGKTVLAAHIVKTLNSCHHFVSVMENRDDKELIVKSLIEQIFKKMKKKCPELRDRKELVALLGSSLTLLSEYTQKKRKSEYIVIDGMDLLENNWLELLPEYLPKGVYILVFCERNDSAFAIKSYYINRLKLSETKAMLANIDLSEAEINEVQNKLEGNPSTISFFANKYDKDVSLEYQIKEARYSLKTDKVLASMSREEQMLFFLLSIAHAPITLNDIISILGKSRMEIQEIITQNKTYILDDKSGIRLIDDEIKIFLNDSRNLADKEIEDINTLHKKMIDYFESRECEYAKKYLIYHYYEIESYNSVIKILLEDVKNQEIYNERRRFVNLLIERDEKEEIGFLLKEIISMNSDVLWHYIFDALRYDVHNKKNYPMVKKIINQINFDDLNDENQKIVQYFQAICMRKEGDIKGAKECLASIDTNNLKAPFHILIRIQLADCARELGEVLESIELYTLIANMPDCEENYPREYWECKLKIIDRMYCDGLYIQTIKSNADAENNCERLLLHDLLLKFYKEDAQVYNDLCMYDETIEIIGNKALELCKTTNNKGMEGELYNLLSVAEIIRNPKNGRKTAKEAVCINDKVGSVVEKGKALLALGMSFFIDQEYDHAKATLEEARYLFDKAGYKSGIARVEHELAKVLFKCRRYEEAMEHIEKSKELFVRDYGITHKIYEYKNAILKSVIEGKEIDENTFAECENIEFIRQRDSFVQAYKEEVVN